MLAYHISQALSFLLLSYLFESISEGELFQGGGWVHPRVISAAPQRRDLGFEEHSGDFCFYKAGAATDIFTRRFAFKTTGTGLGAVQKLLWYGSLFGKRLF